MCEILSNILFFLLYVFPRIHRSCFSIDWLRVRGSNLYCPFAVRTHNAFRQHQDKCASIVLQQNTGQWVIYRACTASGTHTVGPTADLGIVPSQEHTTSNANKQIQTFSIKHTTL